MNTTTDQTKTQTHLTTRERLFRRVASQFGRPRGTAGRLAGWVMAVRGSNVARNRWAVDQLDVEPTHRVLEIGFGPGVAIEELAAQATEGQVRGIDHSDLMVRAASRRNRTAVADGRVVLTAASIETPPGFDEPFDRILAVNNVPFWSNPVDRLRWLASVLSTDGLIALVSQPRHVAANEAATRRSSDELSSLLEQAGFEIVRTPTLELRPPVVSVIARTQT